MKVHTKLALLTMVTMITQRGARFIGTGAVALGTLKIQGADRFDQSGLATCIGAV